MRKFKHKFTENSFVVYSSTQEQQKILSIHPCELRRVVSLVEINGKDVEIAFMTNHSKRGTIINSQPKIGTDCMKQTTETLTKTGVYTPLAPSMG